MPRTTRRRNHRRSSLKKGRRRQRGGQLADELGTWLAEVKQARAEVGDPRNITLADLAQRKIPIGESVKIPNPHYATLTVGDATSHLRAYLGAYFDAPATYTMENIRNDLASVMTTGDEEDLSFEFLVNIEAALSGQNTVDISNIQNYPLFVLYLTVNSEGGYPRPILMQEGLAGPGEQ